MIAELIISFVLSYIVYRVLFKTKERIPDGYKEVPMVKGAYPIIGHALQLKDILGFVRQCYKEYGKIFRLKIFLKELVVVCDRSIEKEYFKHDESAMSLYDVLRDLFFVDAFSDDPNNGSLVIRLTKKSVGVRYEEFAPKIVDEAKKLIERLVQSKDRKVSLTEEMIKFVSCTSSRCFLGYEMSEEFYDTLMKFTHLQNKIVVLTYFLPLWFIRLTFNQVLKRYRYKMTRLIQHEIQKYRDDKNKHDSHMLRFLVDYSDDEIVSLTDQQIGDVIVCLLYVSSENTALGSSAAITDLCRNEKYWNIVRNEGARYLKNGDWKSLLSSPVIQAAIMETARLNSHIFAINRQPKDIKTLGEYYIGDCHSLALCEPILMNYDCAEEKFQNPLEYDLERFLPPRKESKNPYDIMTWGAGRHLCPGKQFAIYEIIAALALLTNYFNKPELNPEDIGKLDYFSPSAFAEKIVKLTLSPLDKPYFEGIKESYQESKFTIKNKEIVLQTYDDNGNKGFLIKNFLTPTDQKQLFEYTVMISKSSKEAEEIKDVPLHRAYPIAYNNLTYTGTSNCERLEEWFKLAEDLKEIKELDISDYQFNSVYCQLFHANGTMRVHKDEQVAIGLSISIGASCQFKFGEQVILLNSGDIFVSDFSKSDHAVLSINEDAIPQWMTETETYNRHRLSVQIREVKDDASKELISIDQFKEMLLS